MFFKSILFTFLFLTDCLRREVLELSSTPRMLVLIDLTILEFGAIFLVSSSSESFSCRCFLISGKRLSDNYLFRPSFANSMEDSSRNYLKVSCSCGYCDLPFCKLGSQSSRWLPILVGAFVTILVIGLSLSEICSKCDGVPELSLSYVFLALCLS